MLPPEASGWEVSDGKGGWEAQPLQVILTRQCMHGAFHTDGTPHSHDILHAHGLYDIPQIYSINLTFTAMCSMCTHSHATLSTSLALLIQYLAMLDMTV